MTSGRPIPVPGMSRAMAARQRWFEMLDRGSGPRGTDQPELQAPETRFRPSAFEGISRPALQGLACQYDVPFVDSNGQILVMMSGALTGSKFRGRKRLLIDHDDTFEVGDTTGGLEFDSNGAFGLSMRFPLTNSKAHGRLAELVRDGDRACLSVGGAITKSHTKTVAGHTVKFIEEFRLDEVSVCFQGANTPAFVELVDLADEPSALAAAARETGFQTKVANKRAQATLRRISKGLEKLPHANASRALNRITRAEPARRAYALDQSNKDTTDWKEGLQRRARQASRW